MKNKFSLTVLFFALIIIFILTFTACTEQQGNTPVVSVAPVTTPMPELTIAGAQLGDNVGVTDITQAVKATVGESSNVLSAVFFSDNVLLLNITESDKNYLVTYSIYGTELARYELPYNAFADYSFSSENPIRTNNGVISVIDPLTNTLILLNSELNETQRYESIMQNPNNTDSWGIMCDYSITNNLLYYAYHAEEPTIFAYDPVKQESKEFFEADLKDGTIASFSLTEDESYMQVAAYSYIADAETETHQINYIIDLESGDVVKSTWLETDVYSNSSNMAIAEYWHYKSDLYVNDVKLDIKYIEEYDRVCFDFAHNTAVTAAVCLDDSADALLLSAYDTQSGAFYASKLIESDIGYLYLPYDSIARSSFSFDPDTGLFLFRVGFADETESLLLWDMHANNELYDNDNKFVKTLTPCINYTDDLTARELSKQIEAQYDISIWFAEGFHEEHETDKLDETVFSTFSKDYNDDYVTECLLNLRDVLAQYPSGMLSKVGFDGEYALNFYLCTFIDDPNRDFDIAGMHYCMGQNNIFADVICQSAGEFRDGGSTSTFSSIWHHEIMHAIQNYLFNMPIAEGNYDYDDWMALQPADYFYSEEPGAEGIYGYRYDENVYFVDDYAATDLREDMSRTYEYATWSEINDALHCPKIKAKLEYLCMLIRNAFDDGTWQDVVLWERALNEQYTIPETEPDA